MLEKFVLTILELNWNQLLGHKRTQLNICHHMLTSSTELQNRSFHVVERTRTSAKCQNMKYAHAKLAKILFFIVKYANLWGFRCRRRRSYLSSLITQFHFKGVLCVACQAIAKLFWYIFIAGQLEYHFSRLSFAVYSLNFNLARNMCIAGNGKMAANSAKTPSAQFTLFECHPYSFTGGFAAIG